jgi:hypothetical protein
VRGRWQQQVRVTSSTVTSCMPCHPPHFKKPSAALPRIASALFSQDAGRGGVVRREAARGFGADNLLTDEACVAMLAACCALPSVTWNQLATGHDRVDSSLTRLRLYFHVQVGAFLLHTVEPGRISRRPLSRRLRRLHSSSSLLSSRGLSDAFIKPYLSKKAPTVAFVRQCTRLCIDLAAGP